MTRLNSRLHRLRLRGRVHLAGCLVLSIAIVALSACGRGPEVIVSEAGGPSGMQAPDEGETTPAPADDGEQGQAEQSADSEQAEPGDPDEVVDEIREELDSQPVSGEDVLDALEPLDDKPSNAEIRDARDDRQDAEVAVVDGPRNEAGEVIELDEPASLACGDAERALTAIDEGDAAGAAADVASATERAGQSGAAEIAAWSETLGEWTGLDGDQAVLLGFLSTCTDGGYEL